MLEILIIRNDWRKLLISDIPQRCMEIENQFRENIYICYHENNIVSLKNSWNI
jgi:hypothetical protein